MIRKNTVRECTVLLSMLACPGPGSDASSVSSATTGEVSETVSISSTSSGTASGTSTSGGGICALETGALWGVLFPSTAVDIQESCPDKTDGDNIVVGRIVGSGVPISKGWQWMIEECPCGMDCPNSQMSILQFTSTSESVDPSTFALPTCLRVEAVNQCVGCVDGGGLCVLENLVVWDQEVSDVPFLVAFSADTPGVPSSVEQNFDSVLMDAVECSGLDCTPYQQMSLEFSGFNGVLSLESGEMKSGNVVAGGSTYAYDLWNVRSYRIDSACDDEWTSGDERVDWIMIGRW